MTLDASPAVVSCSDIFANGGGNALPAGAVDGGGNFSLDPLFCSTASGDYTLGASSPCLNDETCGQVGALGLGCGSTPVESTTWGRVKSRYLLK